MTSASATREQIMAALYNVMQGLLTTAIPTPGPFVTVSRKLRLWGDVDPTMQPALYLVEHKELPENTRRGLDDKNALLIRIFIYARADGDSVIGGTIINNLLDAVETILEPSDPSINVNTLGGLVNRLWIDGETIKDPGDIDGQALAVLPIKILMPNTSMFRF